MAETTGISWCDATINFWHGCKKVSEGCKFCYMYRDKARFNQDGSEVRKTQPGTINRTLDKLLERHYDRKSMKIDEPLKIFTCSYSDFFIEEADSWRKEAWNIIEATPMFVWIILTKRPERIMECLPENWGEGWPNVWLLVSAENQERWNERVPILLQIPAKVRGVSIEPILGPVDISPNPTFGHFFHKLDWIIVGGESGNDQGPWRYRPAQRAWFEQIVKDSLNLGISVFVKQLGTSLAKRYRLRDRAGADLDEWAEELDELKFQQFPL